MRIIAGELRGRRIRIIKGPRVRPISGRIKQPLFDILTPRLPGTRFLDLFAGTGAVGLEALSRGAGFVFFVELAVECVRLIQANLESLGLASRAKVHPGNALADLSWVSFRSGVPRYDIVFMGPPYKTAQKAPLAYVTPTLGRILEADLLSPGGVIISQHHVKEKAEPPETLELFRREKYGDTFLSFYRVKN